MQNKRPNMSHRLWRCMKRGLENMLLILFNRSNSIHEVSSLIDQYQMERHINFTEDGGAKLSW